MIMSFLPVCVITLFRDAQYFDYDWLGDIRLRTVMLQQNLRNFPLWDH